MRNQYGLTLNQWQQINQISFFLRNLWLAQQRINISLLRDLAYGVELEFHRLFNVPVRLRNMD